MCASGEEKVRAKRMDGKRMTMRTKCAGEGMLWGGQGSDRRWRVVLGYTWGLHQRIQQVGCEHLVNQRFPDGCMVGSTPTQGFVVLSLGVK